MGLQQNAKVKRL